MTTGGTRSGGSPSRLRQVEERLALWNQFMLFLARINRLILLAKRAGEARRRKPITSLLYTDFDPHGTIGIISLRLSRLSPMLKDINYVVYVSVQRSKKKVPKQAETIKRRLSKVKVFGDTIKVVIAPKGYTRGAWRVLRKAGIHLALDPKELIELFKQYVSKRAEQLRLALRGKRIWGDVALVALVLYEILNAARIKILKQTALVELYDAAVSGRPVDLDYVIALGSGPPEGPPGAPT